MIPPSAVRPALMPSTCSVVISMPNVLSSHAAKAATTTATARDTICAIQPFMMCLLILAGVCPQVLQVRLDLGHVRLDLAERPHQLTRRLAAMLVDRCDALLEGVLPSRAVAELVMRAQGMLLSAFDVQDHLSELPPSNEVESELVAECHVEHAEQQHDEPTPASEFCQPVHHTSRSVNRNRVSRPDAADVNARPVICTVAE